LHNFHLETQEFKSPFFYIPFLWYSGTLACNYCITKNIERFPYPPGIRWDAPFIPSFTVPYGITRDYFYSGHTGLMLFCTFWWQKLGYTWLYRFSLTLTPFVVLVLLSTRVHYSIDIIAAIIFTFWF
jgi:hypothetical protein